MHMRALIGTPRQDSRDTVRMHVNGAEPRPLLWPVLVVGMPRAQGSAGGFVRMCRWYVYEVETVCA